MSPEMSIDRVRSFIRWGRFHVLDEGGEPPQDPQGWRRGQGLRLEYWIRPKVWQSIFDDDDEGEALAAGQALRDAGLLRLQERAVQPMGGTTIGVRRSSAGQE